MKYCRGSKAVKRKKSGTHKINYRQLHNVSNPTVRTHSSLSKVELKIFLFFVISFGISKVSHNKQRDIKQYVRCT